MKAISKKDFFKIIYEKDLDICFYSQMNSITQVMTTKAEYRNGKSFGKIVTEYDKINEEGLGTVTYYISESEL